VDRLGFVWDECSDYSGKCYQENIKPYRPKNQLNTKPKPHQNAKPY
jgi:hypothetical protein